eukprot:179822_1
MNAIILFLSSSSTKKCIITLSILYIAFKVYQKFKKKQVNKNENLIYQNKNKPAIGSVIGHVSSLNTYPIKSCKAISIKSTQLNIDGFLYDRIIMIINSKLTPITQRMIPKLALIKVEIISNNNTNIISLSLPNEYKIEQLNLNLKSIEESTNSLQTIDLHGIKGKCKDCGDESALWLNNVLSIITGKTKTDYRFVSIGKNESRKIKYSLTRMLVDETKEYDSTRLSDLATFSFVSTGSLKLLNERIGRNKAITVDRFRSNIVFTPLDDKYAFLEDHISILQIGNLKLRTLSPSFRCIIPSINQQTGETDFFKSFKTCEPVNTLRKTRSSLRYGMTGLLPSEMGGSKGLAPVFGLYLGFAECNVEDIENIVINQGDEVIVLKYRDASSGFMNGLFKKIEQFFGINTLQ